MPATLRDDVKKRHGFDSLRREAYLNLSRTQSQASAAMTSLLKTVGLSEATYNILRILEGVHRYPDAGRRSLPCGEVAERMVTRVPDVTRLMDRLEKAGLIARERSDADRRVVLARISPAGRAVLRKLAPKVARVERAMFPALSDRELATLSRLLEKARAVGERPGSG